METKTKGLTVLALVVMVLCAYALIAPAVAQPTPFMSYGHVYYENGTACNNPTVNITNWNTSEQWQATTNASSNYYQRILANGTDLNESEVLQFEVTSPDGSQSKVFNHTVTSAEINQGGLFNFSFALMPAVTAEAAHVANHVVISEFATRGPGEPDAADNEFVELYNPTSSAVDISSWKLEYKLATGGTWSNKTAGLPEGTTIAAHGFYLLASNNYSGSITPDYTHTANWDLADEGHVKIIDASSTVIDLVGYGSTADSAEGNNPAPNHGITSNGNSVERKAIASSTVSGMASSGAHHLWGNGEDTDNNGNDFVEQTYGREPQNSSNATEDSPAQSWFLSNVSGSESYIMYKENMSKPEGNVTVADGGSEIWKANENATVAVGFPAGTWDGKITLETAFAAGDTFTVKVGTYNSSSSNFTAYGTQMISGDGITTSYSLSISASAFTVNANDYLALQINSSGSALVVKTGSSNSYAISPETDPGYPVPELPTLILFSSGLIILACYVVLKRRE